MAFKFIKNLIGKIKNKKEANLEELSEKIKETNLATTSSSEIIDQKANKQKQFDEGLKKSSSTLAKAVDEIVEKKQVVDEALFERIEEMFISYDVGVFATNKILEAIKKEVIYQNVIEKDLLKEIIVDKLFTYYIQNTDVNTFINLKKNQTNVILVMGINGVGKTTSIAKLAYKFKQENLKVLLVAADTFRAGAIEQLKVWSERIGCDIVVPSQNQKDPASVVYSGVKKGFEEKYDLIICDTSGRMHNKQNLMQELNKIESVIKKFNQNALAEGLLVLDATLGQSGLLQAKAFLDSNQVSGIILTKMDGTSKGGILLSIKDNLNLPVKYIGLGEKLEDLSPFDLEKFIIGITKEFDVDNSPNNA